MKIAIVTGASSGLGRETAIQLADRFAGLQEIWLIARRKERLLELEKLLPVPVRIFDIDLRKPAELELLKNALTVHKPNVKLLVNASGYGKIGRVGDITLEDELGMPDLNCTALCAVTHLVLPYISGNSRILQYASSASFLPQPGFAVYAATKAFVLSYSLALHEELRHKNICVTAVCPGPVKTEFFDVAETNAKMPLYKKLTMAEPKKVVKLALRHSMMGKTVSVYGIPMKAFHLLCKLIPHSFILRAMTSLAPIAPKNHDEKKMQTQDF